MHTRQQSVDEWIDHDNLNIVNKTASLNQVLFAPPRSPESLPASVHAYWSFWEQMSPAETQIFLHQFLLVHLRWSESLPSRFGSIPYPIYLHIKFGCFMVKITSSAPHQGKAVLPHGAAGARPCTGGASQGEGTESLLAAAGCAGIKLFLISVNLGHTLLRITLVCLACELSLVAVKNNRRCKNDLFSSYASWILNSSAPPKNVHLRPSPAGQKDMSGSVLRCMVLSLVLSRTRLIGSLT